jgi:hypothetical protein
MTKFSATPKSHTRKQAEPYAHEARSAPDLLKQEYPKSQGQSSTGDGGRLHDLAHDLTGIGAWAAAPALKIERQGHTIFSGDLNLLPNQFQRPTTEFSIHITLREHDRAESRRSYFRMMSRYIQEREHHVCFSLNGSNDKKCTLRA